MEKGLLYTNFSQQQQKRTAAGQFKMKNSKFRSVPQLCEMLKKQSYLLEKFCFGFTSLCCTVLARYSVDVVWQFVQLLAFGHELDGNYLMCSNIPPSLVSAVVGSGNIVHLDKMFKNIVHATTKGEQCVYVYLPARYLASPEYVLCCSGCSCHHQQRKVILVQRDYNTLFNIFSNFLSKELCSHQNLKKP